MRAVHIRVGAVVLATTMGLAACGDGTATPALSAPVAATTPMSITVHPAPNSSEVEPDSIVTVTSEAGALEEVEVTDSTGTVITGEFSADRTAWVADRRLAPNERYTVMSSGISDAGVAVNQTSRFGTLTVAEDDRLASYLMSPIDGSKVGVAHPIVIQFNRSVTDRKAVTSALQVETSRPVEGGWYWIDTRTVHYRPKKFWPAGTKVTVSENLVGLDAGDGVWGVSRRDMSFKVGREQILRVNVRSHRMDVVRKGKVVRSFDVSTGKPGWETRNGVKVLMEKVRYKRWTNEAINAPEEYDLRSSYAIRMTNSGEFVHDAPWNTGNIGRANTSHGCVGMRVTDMRWIYYNSLVGDPVVVTGSPRKFNELWNRYQDWNVTWKQWKTGNYDLSDG